MRTSPGSSPIPADAQRSIAAPTHRSSTSSAESRTSYLPPYSSPDHTTRPERGSNTARAFVPGRSGLADGRRPRGRRLTGAATGSSATLGAAALPGGEEESLWFGRGRAGRRWRPRAAVERAPRLSTHAIACLRSWTEGSSGHVGDEWRASRLSWCETRAARPLLAASAVATCNIHQRGGGNNAAFRPRAGRARTRDVSRVLAGSPSWPDARRFSSHLARPLRAGDGRR